MGIKHLLTAAAVAALGATAAQGATFDWTPSMSQPYTTSDVTYAWQVEEINFVCSEPNVQQTDVMPIWIDDEGNEIKANGGGKGWYAGLFWYTFDLSEFKSNGEYVLFFPQGVLVNEAGEESAMREVYYTFDIPEFNAGAYPDFEVTSVTPDLYETQGLWSNQVVTVNTNHNDAIGLTKLIMTDITDDEVIFTSSNFSTGREPGNPDEITWEVVGEYKFFEGHFYKAEFIFYNGKDEKNEIGVANEIVGRATYEFVGKVAAYQYSAVTLVNVEPTPEVYVISEPSEAVFTFVFSAPVDVWKVETPMGPLGTHVYSNTLLSSNEDKTEWTINLSEDSFVATQDASLVLNVYAVDMDGFVVKGDAGYEENSCFQFGWECELGAPTYTILPAQGEVLDALTEVVCKSDGKEMAWSWLGSATVQTLTRQIVGTLVPEITETASTEVKFTSWINAETGLEEELNLTKGGSYVLVFEKGCFVFGTEYDAKMSHNMAQGFQITGNLYEEPEPAENETFMPSSISPAEGSKLDSLSDVILTFPDEIAIVEYDAYLYRTEDYLAGGDYLQKADIEWPWDWDNMWDAEIHFAPVTEDGYYTVFIPKRSIGNAAFGYDMSGNSGVCNPDLVINYTVGTPTGVESVAEAGASDVYDMQGRIVMRNASAEDLKALNKGVYIVNGKKVIL